MKLSEKQIEARIVHLLDQEALEPEGYFWLSFASETGEFLGVIIVKARGLASAVLETHKLGINPGGQVLVIAMEECLPDPSLTNKPLTKEEVEAITS